MTLGRIGALAGLAALAQKRTEWPPIRLPHDRGHLTPADVLNAAPGWDRDRAIDEWCVSVWQAYSGSRETVIQVLRAHRII